MSRKCIDQDIQDVEVWRVVMEPERIAGLFDQAERKNAEFRKETYAQAFQDYLESNVVVWDMLSSVGAGDMLLREQEQAEMQAAEAFVCGARQKVDTVKGRTKREKMQYDLNLYMVSYVLPAVIAWHRRCGIREEETKRLTEMICGRWQEAFGARIRASDFESIQAGFRQKLCFVTTAVCRGLQKPQNCREILLMKRFRDGYFVRSAEGKRLIDEYYDIAPTIVKRIARDADPEEKYRYLWNTYIRKCVDHIEKEQNEQCSRLYKSMMAELKAEYMVIGKQ